ncbi:MAG TPA: hypothetical protein VH436_18840, partial [Vicinamibacterales bacterium]
QGLHKPIISRDLFARVQDVFAAANHSKHTMHGTRRRTRRLRSMRLELAQTAFHRMLRKIREQARLVKRLYRTRRAITEVFHRLTLSRSTYWRMEEKLEIGSPSWIRTRRSEAPLHCATS